MNLLESIKLAMRSIQGNLLRAILTVLIIAIGLTAMVGIQTSIDGLKSWLNSDFASMGSNSFSIRYLRDAAHGNQGKAINSGPITFRQATQFKEVFSEKTKVALSTNLSYMATVRYQSEKTHPNIALIGADESFLEIAGYDLDEGRLFSRHELEGTGLSCILGADVVKDIFPENTSALDKHVVIQGKRFRVIGVLKSKGASVMSTDNLAIIPLSTARAYMSGPNPVFEIGVMMQNPKELEAAVGDATGLFRKIRKLRAGQPDDFVISRSDNLAEMLIEQLSNVSVGAKLIGLFTIFGAAIGLMNIMLVSVNERTREIGVSMAIGATRQAIRTQFLTESVVICLIGGAVGIIMGIIIGNVVAGLIGAKFLIPWVWIFGGLLLCLIVGIAAGIYPAIKAGKLDPIEALRYE